MVLAPRLSLVIVLLLAATAAAAANADGYAAAVLPLMAPDLLEPQKRALDERIRAIAGEAGVTLQPAADTVKSIEQAKKAGAACNIESLACQAQMGVLVGAKQVIIARVASDWAGDRLELRLLDALRGSTIREAAHLLPKEPELRARVIEGVILAVLAPTKTGAIVVTAPAGAIFLNGVLVPPQASETPRIEFLAPGPHEVELRVDGQPALQKRVLVVSGETAAVSIGERVAKTLPPATVAQESPSAGLWLVGGGAILAVAAGASAGGFQAALEYSAIERSTRGALQATGIALMGATAIGVVVAGAGGIMMAVGDAP